LFVCGQVKIKTGAKKMISRDITIKNSVGLYARPATFFIQKANSYKSSIWIEKDDRRVNAKSLLGILSLAIASGTTITLVADGPDEAEAISGIEDLVSKEI
jgi:phosphocarrier protein